MDRFTTLLETVERYQDLAAENYNRIRRLAEDVRQGFCDFLNAQDGACVHLVPPMGPFEPRAYGDQAFTMPPRGFRPLAPVSFGLAVRVTRDTNWVRLTMLCTKMGDDFTVAIQGGPEYTFQMPVSEHDPSTFYQTMYEYILNQFADALEKYENGAYATRAIGFDFTGDREEATG